MQISRHVVSSSDLDPRALTITHSDQKGLGGDNHRYCISNFNTMDNYNRQATPGYEHLPPTRQLDILFQSGNPAEGFNGITIEALLAICEHRLLGCQEGPYQCEENLQALLGVSHALHSLHRRTIRVATDKVVTEIKDTLGLSPDQATEALNKTLKAYHSIPNTNNAVKQLLEQVEQKK